MVRKCIKMRASRKRAIHEENITEKLEFIINKLMFESAVWDNPEIKKYVQDVYRCW